MSEKIKYKLETFYHNFYLHDKTIDRMYYSNQELVFIFENGDFISNKKKYNFLKIIFSGMDDVYSDIRIYKFKTNNCSFKGRLYFLNDKNLFIFKEDIRFEIIDFYCEFNKVLIKTNIIKKNNTYGDEVFFEISCEEIVFNFNNKSI